MGGLREQLFNVTGLRNQARTTTGDQFRAVSALISGDDAVVTGGYVETVIAADPDALAELQEPLPEDRLREAPEIIRKTFVFPQVEGGNFVNALIAEGGSWETVNRAYRSPPLSSEQVIHPEKYFSNEAPLDIPLPDLSPLMGGGWSLTALDTMGEFLLRSYLEEHLGKEEAARGADGWAGDKYLLMSNPEMGRLLVAMIEFDSASEAAEFYQAFGSFMEAAAVGADVRSESMGPRGVMWEVDGGRTVFLGQAPPGALLIVGDAFEAVDRGLDTVSKAMSGNQSR